MRTTFTADLGFDTMTICADFSQASSQITYLVDDEEHSTPYQVADARHDVEAAMVMVIAYMGRDYWADPTDEWDEDEDEDKKILALFDEITDDHNA